MGYSIGQLYTIRLAGPEMISAIFRKASRSEITQSDAMRAAIKFKMDWQSHYKIIEVSVGISAKAMLLAEKFLLRGYDAVHLAAAMELQDLRSGSQLLPITFVSADERLIQAAIDEGLKIENPNQHQ